MSSITFPQSREDFSRDRWSMRRYLISMIFLMKHVRHESKILDLGTPNALSEIMKEQGYKVINTKGEDLDNFHNLIDYYLVDADCTTAFEILEHLVNPYEVLRIVPTGQLIASVPLRLWFAKAYNRAAHDRHFHEFEPWQFDCLLEKAGWKILDREFHTSPTFRLGFRSILRWIYPRWYFVYCIRV
jgi:hypothetical protein